MIDRIEAETLESELDAVRTHPHFLELLNHVTSAFDADVGSPEAYNCSGDGDYIIAFPFSDPAITRKGTITVVYDAGVKDCTASIDFLENGDIVEVKRFTVTDDGEVAVEEELQIQD